MKFVRAASSCEWQLRTAMAVLVHSTVVADERGSCADDPAFTDELGWACDSWVGFDCSDQQTALAWGYTAEGMDAIAANCPYSCGTCADAPAAAETATLDSWSGIPLHGASPPPLREMTLLARSIGGVVNEVALWGGTTGTALNGELYLLRTGTFVWRREPITSGTRPAARSRHGSVLQSGHRMIIVGGVDSRHFMRNDVWQIDLNEQYKSWQQLSPDGATSVMSRRIAPGVAALNDSHLLISGGSSAHQYGVPDLWLLDTRTGDQQLGNTGDIWQLLHTWTPGETGPRACYLPLLVVDPDSSGVRSVWGMNGNNLFGASLSDLAQTQTWRFDLANETWSKLPALGDPPPDLWAPLATSVDVGGSPHVIGGFGWSSSGDTYVEPAGSMYSLSLDGVWTHLRPSLNDSTAVCEDDRLFLDEFGEPCSAWSGYDCSDRQQAEDWGYSPSTVDQVMAACPRTCGLCLASVGSETTPSYNPPGRSDGGLVALSETEFLIFGGWGASSMWNDLVLFRSTDARFTSVANNSVSPEPRKGASIVAIGAQSFMFGGESDNGERLQDLWSLTMTELNGRLAVDGWRVIDIVGRTPGRRSYHAAGSSGRKMCVHGGQHANGYLLHDMWCLDTVALRWDEIRASHVPPARKGHTLVAVGDSKWVLFGGTGAKGTLDDATWIIDLQTDSKWWRLDCALRSAAVPAARRWHGAARVRINGTDMMAVIGGENQAAEEQADMWLLEHHDFQLIQEGDGTMGTSAGCRRDDGKLLRTTWHLVENYIVDLSPCSTWSNCDYYTAGRSRFALAGSQSNVLIIAGGVTDYGAHALRDVVHVVISETGSGYRINPRWVEVDTEFTGSRVHSAGACLASDVVLFAGAERIWQSTELSLTSNEAFRLSFAPCESMASPEASACVPCSPGFVADNSSGSLVCVPCPIGTYSSFNGETTQCVECPRGYEGIVIAASSPDQCSPCPAFTHYERQVGCVPCNASERCPIATIQPEPLNNFTGVVSKQPKILLSREQQVWTAQKTVYVATLVALIVLTTMFAFNMVMKPHNQDIRSMDLLFANAHAAGFYSAKVGFNSQKKKTAVGGWFTLLTGVSAVAYVIVLIMPLVLNNTEETQSLQPNLVWASTNTEHKANFEFQVQLKGYRGQCTKDLARRTCSDRLTVTTDSPQFPGKATVTSCEVSNNDYCTLIWKCEDCVVEGVVTIAVAFQEAFAFTHEMTWSVESDSSFVDGSGPDGRAQKSFLHSTVQSSSPEHSFRGLRPTVIRLIARPSIYTFQTTAEKAVGYHLEYVTTTRGSEVTESSFNDANGVKVVFEIEQAPATLATVRVVHQSIFVFLSNSSAAILGLLGVFSYLLGHVESWYYKSRPFESLDRADLMVADWMRTGAPKIFEQLNEKHFKTSADEEKFLSVRARCLQSDIFQVFDRFDIKRKGFLTRTEFQDFMSELDIILTENDRKQVEDFFEDGRVTFSEFKEFYLDHTQRTQHQRRRVVTERLESTPRGRAAKSKWQSKVHTLNAVRLLGQQNSSTARVSSGALDGTSQDHGEGKQKPETEEAEADSRTVVRLTGTELRKDASGKEFTVFIIECKRFDGTIVYPEPKRFSEFFALRSALVKAGRDGIEKIDFPARKVRRSSSSSQSTVQQRQQMLEAWLNEVLFKYATDPAVIDFVATRSKSFWNIFQSDGGNDEEQDKDKLAATKQQEEQQDHPISNRGAAPRNLLLALRASAEDDADENDRESITVHDTTSTMESTPPARSTTTVTPRSNTPPPRRP